MYELSGSGVVLTCWSCGDGLLVMFDLASPDAGSHLCDSCERRWVSMSRHPSLGSRGSVLATAPFPLLESRPASVN